MPCFMLQRSSRFLFVALVFLLGGLVVRFPGASADERGDSSLKELRILKKSLTAKDYHRMLADRVLDNSRYTRDKNKIISFAKRQQRPEQQRSSRANKVTGIRSLSREAADERSKMQEEAFYSLGGEEDKREKLRRLYVFLENLQNSSNTTNTNTRSTSLSVSKSASVSPTASIFLINDTIYETAEVLNHVFVVNFFSFHEFTDFNQTAFAEDLILMLAALQIEALGSSTSTSTTNSHHPHNLWLETVDNAVDIIGVMKCVIPDAQSLPSPINFSVCRDDAAGPKCVIDGSAAELAAECKDALVYGCSCADSLASFPPTERPISDAVSLPLEHNSSTTNSTSEDDASPATKDILGNGGGGEEGASLLSDVLNALFSSKRSASSSYFSSIESSATRRPRRALRPQSGSRSLQIQMVFLLEHANGFFPRNYTDIARSYDELINLTVTALTSELMTSKYFVRGIPVVTPLVYPRLTTVTPTTLLPQTTTLAPSTEIPAMATTTAQPTTTTSSPAVVTRVPTLAPAKIVVLVASTSAVYYALYALLVFPAALFLYAVFRVARYIRWRQHTKDFSVKPKVVTDDDDEGGRIVAVDVDVEKSIGEAAWIHERKTGGRGDDEGAGAKGCWDPAESFDPIHRNEQKHLLNQTTEASDVLLDDTTIKPSDDPAEGDGERVGAVAARRPITSREHLRANAAVLQCINVVADPPAGPLVPKASAGLLGTRTKGLQTGLAKPSQAPANPMEDFAAVLCAGEASKAQQAVVEQEQFSNASGGNEEEEEEEDEEEVEDEDGLR